jgi:transposase
MEELIKHVDKSCREIAKLYNVSPNTISRWFKSNNIKKNNKPTYIS